MTTNKLVVFGMVVVLGAFASQASAALVICQKGKKIKLRADVCKSKETQVPATDLGATGPEGPAGPAGPAGPEGAPGSARAWAQVTPSGPAIERGLNFDAVTRPSTGVYCLTPTPSLGIDPTQTTILTSVEWGHSSGDDLLVSAQNAVSEFACPAGDFEVRTFKLPGGTATLSNSVGFMVLIP